MTDKKLERRRKKYKYALVKWSFLFRNDGYRIEHKGFLGHTGWHQGFFEIICDHQPHHVLKSMLKLLTEEE